MVNLDLERILLWLVPDPQDCADAAEALRLRDPNAPPQRQARRAVKESRKWAAGIGGATGLAASPISMLPAAMADAAAMLKIEGKLAGTVAALIDPESLNDRETFRKEILRVVFPAAASQALRKLGVRAGETATKNVVRKLLGREAGKELGERAVKFMGIRLTEKAIATKTVPLVGAAIGAGWNWLEIQAVGKRAINYHLGIESPATRTRKRVAAYMRDKTRKRQG